MKCPKCQFENPAEARFCAECGGPIEFHCPKCGAKTLAAGKFCIECGHDLRKPSQSRPIDYSQPRSYTSRFLAEKILTTRSSIEGERKVVTVLFADVAKYTSIAEKLDPEEAHQILDGCFKILLDEVHRYEGTINQFTGDGVMALFGAPLAHEDHAQRACHAALAIQRAIGGYGEKIRLPHGAEFKMRIGMNSGPVVVGSIGDDLRMDYTAVGDTTNLAHRMQNLANPGSTLVSGHTHRLTKDFFEFAFLGKLKVKGKEQPQEAYELLKSRAIETRIGASMAKGLTRFVGRRREMEALREAFDKAQSGSGQVVGIVGEAGVGKSRLILELRKLLPEGQYSFLEGRCLHYGSKTPYLPVLDVLKEYFGIEEGDREPAIKKKIWEKYRERIEAQGSTKDSSLSRTGGSTDNDLLSPVVQGRQMGERAQGKPVAVPPALHEVLSLRVEDDKYPQLGPQQRRERTFEAIRDLLIRESQRKPLILAIEDLHWIDRTSQEFLDYLIGFLPTARILLILLYRPEFAHTWGSKSYYIGVGLNQLSAQRSAELVQAILEGGDVAPEIAGLVLGKAGGNPLFVEELTHSLLENGSIQRKDHRFVLTRKPTEIEVPDTIQGIIAARMDRIEENLKRIMQVASVIGREFAYRILAAITGMSEELKASLVNLQGLEFIYEKQLFPELEYIFKHALTQEVAYNSLLVKRRKEIHERIGRAIEELYAERLEEYYEILVYHYVRTDSKEKAVYYLDLANQKAFRANAMPEAKGYFDQAMEILDRLPNTLKNREHRISLLVKQAEVFGWLLQLDDYYNLLLRYEPIVDKEKNPNLAGGFRAWMGDLNYLFGHIDEAIQNGTEALELCRASGETEFLGTAYCCLIISHWQKGNFDQVIRLKEDFLREGARSLDLTSNVVALCGASWAIQWLGRWDEALEQAQKALSLAEHFEDKRLICYAAWAISWTYSRKGDLNRAIEFGELAVKNAHLPMDKAMAQPTLGLALCRAGRAKEAIGLTAPIVRVLQATHAASYEWGFGSYLAEAYLMAMEYQKARATAERLLQMAERGGAITMVGYYHRLLGEIALKTNPQEAAEHSEKAICIFRQIKAENELALAYSGMGRLHKLRGEHAEARRYLTDALEIFERLGTLIEPDKVRKELTELPSGS